MLSKFDLAKRKPDQLIAGIQNAAVSFNGEKYLYQQGEKWFIAATAQPAKPGEGELKMDAMEVWVEPRAEWSQMYHEIWRIERDFLYDPHSHGVNLQGFREEYEPYLAGIATPRRFELSLRADAQRNQRRPHVRWRRRHSRSSSLCKLAFSVRTTRSKTGATASRASITAKTGTRNCTHH